MPEGEYTVESMALMLLHRVANEAQVMPPPSPLMEHYQEVRGVLENYPFDRFVNWGLRQTGHEHQQQGANYFLRTYNSVERAEFERRVAAINHPALLSGVTEFCQARYGSRIRSLLVFGGYVYGVTPQPDDLDLVVVLGDSQVVENAVVFKWDGLNDIISHRRKPINKLGLTVVGMQQINGLTQNNTVLRTAVIAGTTAIPLWGSPYQYAPVPVAVLLYHAIEMVTWGFRLCFETNEQAHNRALWRIVEAVHILMYVNAQVHGPLPNRFPWTQRLRNHLSGSSPLQQTSLEIFHSSTELFRQDVLALQDIIRKKAIALMDPLVRAYDYSCKFSH